MAGFEETEDMDSDGKPSLISTVTLSAIAPIRPVLSKSIDPVMVAVPVPEALAVRIAV